MMKSEKREMEQRTELSNKKSIRLLEEMENNKFLGILEI